MLNMARFCFTHFFFFIDILFLSVYDYAVEKKNKDLPFIYVLFMQQNNKKQKEKKMIIIIVI
jgi:hypothetical protein